MPRTHPPTLITLARAALRDHDLVPRGALVLVAVSGGPDSMALLHVLALLRHKLAFGLFAHGVDHGLRAGGHRGARPRRKLCAHARGPVRPHARRRARRRQPAGACPYCPVGFIARRGIARWSRSHRHGPPRRRPRRDHASSPASRHGAARGSPSCRPGDGRTHPPPASCASGRRGCARFPPPDPLCDRPLQPRSALFANPRALRVIACPRALEPARRRALVPPGRSRESLAGARPSRSRARPPSGMTVSHDLPCRCPAPSPAPLALEATHPRCYAS